MDEILIEEKKYISSKQAAKLTGYAKDYIGQLCREGRVPARLVGRSWYVLETAIQDHRFGDISSESEKNEKEPIRVEPFKAAFPATWEAPRYEASSVELLPSIKHVQEAPTYAHIQEDSEVSEHLQDSWRAWFDHIEPAASNEISLPEPEENKEVDIPIHTVYEPVRIDLVPDFAVIKTPDREEQPMYQEEISGKRAIPLSIQLAGAICALVLAILAVAGTGYLDGYILSSSQARIIAGVSLYNK